MRIHIISATSLIIRSVMLLYNARRMPNIIDQRGPVSYSSFIGSLYTSIEHCSIHRHRNSFYRRITHATDDNPRRKECAAHPMQCLSDVLFFFVLLRSNAAPWNPKLPQSLLRDGPARAYDYRSQYPVLVTSWWFGVSHSSLQLAFERFSTHWIPCSDAEVTTSAVVCMSN